MNIGSGHQRVFHCMYKEKTPIDTDTLVALITDRITWSGSVKVLGVNRNENVITIKYHKRISVPFGKFTVGDTEVEIMRKRDIEKRLSEHVKDKWPSKWGRL